MNAIKVSSYAMLAAVFALGCGAADSSEEGSPDVVEATDATGARLAELEFEDGSRVFFEELDGGVLVTELGSQSNSQHLVPRPGETALDAFQALAPSRAVPEALMKAHLRMHPPEAVDQAVERKPDLEETARDLDLEHNGEFQQSALPFATFAAQTCDFPSTSPNYKHSNTTLPHNHPTNNVNTAYFAVGSDVGSITSRYCANSSCSNTQVINAGFRTHGFYDAGKNCSKECSHILGIPLGCVTICSGPKLVRFEGQFGQVSSRIRYHDCARFTR